MFAWRLPSKSRQGTPQSQRNFFLGSQNCALFSLEEKSAVEAVLGVFLGDECQHPQQQVPTKE
jgi:hypothetical protein